MLIAICDNYISYQCVVAPHSFVSAIQMGRPSKVRNINGSDCQKLKESKAPREEIEWGFTGVTDEWLKYYTDCALKHDAVDKSNNGVTSDSSSGVSAKPHVLTNGSKSSIRADVKSGDRIGVSKTMPFSLPVASHEAESRSSSSADDEKSVAVESFEAARSKSSEQVSEYYRSQKDNFGFVVPQKESDLRKSNTAAPLDNPLSAGNHFAVRSASRLLTGNDGCVNGLLSSSGGWGNMSSTLGLKRTLSMSSGGYCELNIASSSPFRQRAFSELKRPSAKCVSDDVEMTDVNNANRNVSEGVSSLHFVTNDNDEEQADRYYNESTGNEKAMYLNGDLKRKKATSPAGALSLLSETSPERQNCIPNKSSSAFRGASRSVDEMLRPLRHPLTGSDNCRSMATSNLETLPSDSSLISDVSLVSPYSGRNRSASLSLMLKKRRQPSDRDSPYCTIFALASSCQLFSEASKNPLAYDGSCDGVVNIFERINSDEQMRIVRQYWLESSLPDENIIFNDKHKEIIKQILAAYERFVQTGTHINETLRIELEVSEFLAFNLIFCFKHVLYENVVSLALSDPYIAKNISWIQIDTVKLLHG